MGYTQITFKTGVRKMKLNIEWDIIRASKGVSWVAVAKKINCNRKTLYTMVNSSNPTVKTLEKLGAALDVDYLDVVRAARDKQEKSNES
jgi:DNA-binding phage protein